MQSPYLREGELTPSPACADPDHAYAGAAAALWTWQREAGLSDKALARLAGVSPHTVKTNRQRGDIFGLKTLYRLRAALPASWWNLIVGPPDDAVELELAARAAALETRLAQLRADIARARAGRDAGGRS